MLCFCYINIVSGIKVTQRIINLYILTCFYFLTTNKLLLIASLCVTYFHKSITQKKEEVK